MTTDIHAAGEALICNKCGYVGTEHHHLRAGKLEACPYVARRFTLSDIWTAEDNKRLSEQLEAIRAANRKHNGILWQRMRAQGDEGPWKVGDEFLPYHPSASHCPPDYRDGWNHCYAASESAQALKNRTVRAMLTHYEKWGDTEGFGQMVQAVKELFYPESAELRGDGGKERKG